LSETSYYTRHKIASEQLVRESGLSWMIIRFAGVMAISLARTHPLMFEIPLNNRFEVTHPADAGTAVARAITQDSLWGKVVLVGGGPRCQMTYGDFLGGMLTALGVGPLPPEAFTDRPYPGDWFDTTESQALLAYQQHTFEDIQREIMALLGWRRYIMPFVRPFARRAILNLSPYWMSRKKGTS
jgi:nucleoside-diphosphate-sugar epimerase